MTGNTHFSLGVAAGAIVVGATGAGESVGATVATVAIASFGSLLPDIDEDGSMLNNLLFRSIKYRSAALSILGAIAILLTVLKGLDLWVLLSGIYAMAVAFIPHRSFTHSLLSLLIVSGITLMANPDYVWAMAAGYVSHLLADAMTAGGIPLLWPWKKRLGVKKLGLYIRSGDKVDKMTGKVAMYAGSIVLIWLVFQDASFASAPGYTKDPLEAVRGYFPF
ncbi:metal-dependent hydrolase [Paludifilum halophilum]|nr:metal-dependent hydrolase [Paludifilum halophilum]